MHIYLQRAVLSIECPVVIGIFVPLFTRQPVYSEKKIICLVQRNEEEEILITLVFYFHILFPVNCSRSVAFVITSHETLKSLSSLDLHSQVSPDFKSVIQPQEYTFYQAFLLTLMLAYSQLTASYPQRTPRVSSVNKAVLLLFLAQHLRKKVSKLTQWPWLLSWLQRAESGVVSLQGYLHIRSPIKMRGESLLNYG